MTTKTKLASAALAGLLTAGIFTATSAFADNHDKGSCHSKSGCKGKSTAEKSECKGHAKDEKSSCHSTDKASCSGKSGCSGKK